MFSNSCLIFSHWNCVFMRVKLSHPLVFYISRIKKFLLFISSSKKYFICFHHLLSKNGKQFKPNGLSPIKQICTISISQKAVFPEWQMISLFESSKSFYFFLRLWRFLIKFAIAKDYKFLRSMSIFQLMRAHWISAEEVSCQSVHPIFKKDAMANFDSKLSSIAGNYIENIIHWNYGISFNVKSK